MSGNYSWNLAGTTATSVPPVTALVSGIYEECPTVLVILVFVLCALRKFESRALLTAQRFQSMSSYHGHP
jgi:hypothetical protein